MLLSMSEKTTGRESDKFMLRLPEGMRERIAAEAKASGRSMNAEIVHRLNLSFGEITVTDDDGQTHAPFATLEYVDTMQTILEAQTAQIERLVDAVSKLDPSYIAREKQEAEQEAHNRLARIAAEDPDSPRTRKAKRKGD